MGFVERYGSWAVIAGASEGIGSAFAHAIARRGLNLVLIARRRSLLEATARQIHGEFDIATKILSADLGSYESIARVIEITAPLEVGLLVYNAALSQITPFLDANIENLESAVRINCISPLRLIHYFAKPMVQRGRGGIILMSSLSGFQGSPFISTYAATKAFSTVLAEGLWYEFRGQGVDVLACCAGATMTPGYIASKPQRLPWMAPRVLSPQEVVDEALDALGDKPNMIPGFGNRFARFITGHLMSRRKAVSIMGATGRELNRVSVKHNGSSQNE